MTPLFTKIDHVAINTLDIERSMIFYQQTFGFKHYFETTLPNGHRIVYLKLADTILELNEALTGASGCHFCLSTHDFDQAIKYLEKQNLLYHMPPHHTAPRNEHETNWLRAVFLGPDKEHIEIRGPASNHFYHSI